MIRQLLLLSASFILIGGSIFVFYRLALTPRNDLVWLPEQERTATAEVSDTIILHNVRDWTYDENGPVTREWTDVVINPDDIETAWFLIEPFSAVKAIGHTFLSFTLKDGRSYSFSVEARRESDETYSALRGLFNEYELSYQWGTERDFVTRRLVFLQHPLRRYPLELNDGDAKRLFLSLVEETNALAATPRFYNSLSANCTNVLATIVNKHYRGRLMYDISWYLTGYADEYLMRENLIAQSGTVEETKAAHDLTQHRALIQENSTTSAALFSTLLANLATQ